MNPQTPYKHLKLRNQLIATGRLVPAKATPCGVHTASRTPATFPLDDLGRAAALGRFKGTSTEWIAEQAARSRQ